MKTSLFLTLILMIVLTTFASGAGEENRAIEKIRVLGPNNIPVKVFAVLDPGRNDQFIRKLFSVIVAINDQAKLRDSDEEIHLHLVTAYRNAAEKLVSELRAEDRKYLEVNDQIHVGNDIWMQDWGEIGTVRYVGDAKEYPLIIDSNRGRGIGDLPAVLAKMWDLAYIKNPHYGSCGDYGGNTEVTPENILVLGDTSTEEYRKMFSDHGYADRMVIVDTAWLVVGHCDEYLSFCPNKNSPTGYSIIRANPRQALGLIKRAQLSDLKAIDHEPYRKMLTEVHYYLNDVDQKNNIASATWGMDAGKGAIAEYTERKLAQTLFRTDSMDDELNLIKSDMRAKNAADRSDSITEGLILKSHGDGLLPGKKYSQAAVDFVALNLKIAEIINKNLKKILNKVDEVRKTPNGVHSFLSFPLLYKKHNSTTHIAYFPGVVNMLIVRDNLVIPDTHVPFINEYIAGIARKLDLPSHFLDDMHYHELQGEIHCGTNVFRVPDKFIVKPAALIENYRNFMEHLPKK